MKISVCMCTYNGELYIKEQLDSLVTQTQVPDEIIIFDDCSVDNTVNIINNYIIKYKNIVWNLQVNKKNKGWKVNFKDAINQSTGDYIFLCDQDDIWMNDKIEKMINIISKREDIELLTCNQIIKYEETGRYKKIFKEDKTIEKVIKDRYLTFTARPGCTFCFKRSIINEYNEVWESNFPHDAILWKIAYLRETLYIYNYYGIVWRRHKGNATNKSRKQLSSENIKTHYDVILLYEEYFNKLKGIHKISKRNSYKVKNVIKMLNLRKELYETKKIYNFLKLFKYKNFYASKKAYCLDLLAITKLNNCIGGKDENKNN